jgi:hypothetical protein
VPERETVCALESRYATPVHEAIRRAAADGTPTGNFHSNSPAVFVAFQPKQPCDFIVTERVHFSASYRLIRQS